MAVDRSSVKYVISRSVWESPWLLSNGNYDSNRTNEREIAAIWLSKIQVDIVWGGILGTFRFEYQYAFLISNQSPPLNPHSSLLLTSRSGDCRNEIDVTSDHLKHANMIWEVVLELDLVLILISKGPYYPSCEGYCPSCSFQYLVVGYLFPFFMA